MKYMLIMYTNPADTLEMADEDIKRIEQKHETLLSELRQRDQLISGSGLMLPEKTITLHTGNGVTNGPLPVLDIQKQMTAYYIVECNQEQDALQIAEAILDDHVTDIEVRGIHNSVNL